jgi:S1-C subfamily serine protease
VQCPIAFRRSTPSTLNAKGIDGFPFFPGFCVAKISEQEMDSAESGMTQPANRTATHTLKRLAALTVLVAFGIAAEARAELKPEKLYRKVLPSVMTMEVENIAGERFIGSGVMVLKDDLAVTSWHVVNDARSVWAVFADGQRVRVTGCVDQDGPRDLALVRLEKPMPNRRATLSTGTVPVASRAYVIGAPKGYDFSIADGLVSQIRQVDGFPQYQLSCPISPGNSGGPVLNERGQVIGITSWTKSDAQNLSFAVPTKEIGRLDPSRPAIDWKDLGSSARPGLAARSVNLGRPQVTAKTTGPEPDDLEALRKRLEKSAGKTVTVSVQEGGEENKFTFKVPSTGLP